jgi:hypothetical protein
LVQVQEHERNKDYTEHERNKDYINNPESWHRRSPLITDHGQSGQHVDCFDAGGSWTRTWKTHDGGSVGFRKIAEIAEIERLKSEKAAPGGKPEGVGVSR